MATGTLSPSPWFTGLDDDGNPVSGGKLYTYEAGTTTPLATYTDVGLTVPNANPIILNAAGVCVIYLSAESYKFVLNDSLDALVREQDNISAVAPFDVDVDIPGVAGEDIDANDAVYLSDGHGATTPGLWYKGDATLAASSSDAGAVALAPAAIGSGDTGSFRLSGRMTGFVALTPGAKYYMSDTPGALVTPAPVSPLFARFMGVADNTGTGLVIPTNASASASGSNLDIVQIWAFS